MVNAEFLSDSGEDRDKKEEGGGIFYKESSEEM